MCCLAQLILVSNGVVHVLSSLSTLTLFSKTANAVIKSHLILKCAQRALNFCERLVAAEDSAN